jgi:2-oxoglutarate ferredoxin oxidoreductase subunit alpha
MSELASGLQLLDGCAAITESAVAAGCRFFAGYPISPFTGLLENMSKRLPLVGGTCINAESEIEGVNMALGASAAGTRSATGSCGQGIALMQEAIAEMALNETPMVVFNMARNQQDYFQATRGGGWGDYRTPTLAPQDVPEAVEHTQLLFHLADKYRIPVMMYGDPLIAQTQVSVDVQARQFEALPPKDWALDGSSGGSGKSRQIWTWAMGKVTDPGLGPDGQWRAVAAKFDAIAEVEQRSESYRTEDAETVVVAFGSAALFARYVVDELREQGHRIGLFRPITLWPFPGPALEAATIGAKRVLVFELNAGQMIDDVRQYVYDRRTVRFIGGVSIHSSGLSFGPLLDADPLHARILAEIQRPMATTTGGPR